MKAFQIRRTEPAPTPENPAATIQAPDGIRFEPDNYTPAENEIELPALPFWNPATHRIEWDSVAWQVIPLTSIQLADKAAEAAWRARKVWQTAYDLLQALTPQEQVSLLTSTDSQTIVLRTLLLAWQGAIHSDDPRIIDGFAYLVSIGILTPARASALLTK